MKFVIKGNPICKKNCMRIVTNRITGRPFLLPSTQFVRFEREAKQYLEPVGINYPVNVRCVFYMKTKRQVDITNLLNAIDDILVTHGVLDDDNRDIVAGHNGSLVLYDADNPRTEIEITKIEGYEVWSKLKKKKSAR